jgi:hypothetical protein
MQFEDDLVTVGGGSMRFTQDKSGDYLLWLINKEISEFGGRVKMGYHITHKEAFEWFDTDTRKHFKWRLSQLEIGLANRKINASEKTWKDEEVKYLLEYWSKLDLDALSKFMDRSKNSIRFKAKAIMSTEQFENRFYNREKAGVDYKAKVRHTKHFKKRYGSEL